MAISLSSVDTNISQIFLLRLKRDLYIVSVKSLEKDKKIFLTGITGFLGSHVAEKLSEQGYYVLGLVRGLKRPIENNFITPTINYLTKDSDCDLNYVPNKGVSKKINYAMSNNFGFGGHNSVLIFKGN